MDTEDNASQQKDEIEALSAIYDSDFRVVNKFRRSYSLSVMVEQHTVKLLITLPLDYPNNSPPHYDIDAHWLWGVRKQQLQRHLDEIYLENVGNCVLYLWGERIRQFLLHLQDVEDAAKGVADMIMSEDQAINPSVRKIPVLQCPAVVSGQLITNRKSVFQPHFARVISKEQVPLVLQRLKENRKIASATHNIYAYRISSGHSRVPDIDYDDDGEAKAGGRLLHLMETLGALDVVVVVTRWYGGIHLGADRFKHINAAARQILDQGGFIKQSGASSGPVSRKNKSASPPADRKPGKASPPATKKNKKNKRNA